MASQPYADNKTKEVEWKDRTDGCERYYDQGDASIEIGEATGSGPTDWKPAGWHSGSII